MIDTLTFQKISFSKSSLLLPKNSNESMIMFPNVILVYFEKMAHFDDSKLFKYQTKSESNWRYLVYEYIKQKYFNYKILSKMLSIYNF